MKLSFHRIILSGIFLLTGFSIYMLWRPEGLVFGKLWDIDSIVSPCCVPPSWVVYSLPDALWYAALLTAQPDWREIRRCKLNSVLTIVSVLLPYIHESGQLIGIFPGNYDNMDMVLYFVTTSIYFLLCISRKKIGLSHSTKQ